MDYNYEFLIISVEKGIATISLDSPHNLNALSQKLTDGLLETIIKMDTDKNINVIVIRSNGKGFSAGGDMKEFQRSTKEDPKLYMDEITSSLYKLLAKIFSLSKPVIATVNNFAMGAGCNLALVCDFVFATRNTRFGESFVNIGLMPGGSSTYILPRMIGHKKAAEFFFFGKTVNGIEAEELGLITKAVENEEELEKIAYDYAERLNEGPTKAFSKIKPLISKSFSVPMDEYLEMERQAQIDIAGTEDFEEGVNAFFEKRKPVYKGK